MIRALALSSVAFVALATSGAAQAPTPADLGVPVYPGARYEATMSQGMSQEREKYYVFTTPDALDRVKAFYESATRHASEPFGDGGAVMIALAGQAPFPTHGIVIEPSRPGMFPPAVRTVITVRRELPNPDETPRDTARTDTTTSRGP